MTGSHVSDGHLRKTPTISTTSETVSVKSSSSAGNNQHIIQCLFLKCIEYDLKKTLLVSVECHEQLPSQFQVQHIYSSLHTFVLITGDMVSKGSRLTVQEIIDESSVIPLQPTDSTSPGIKH